MSDPIGREQTFPVSEVQKGDLLHGIPLTDIEIDGLDVWLRTDDGRWWKYRLDETIEVQRR